MAEQPYWLNWSEGNVPSNYGAFLPDDRMSRCMICFSGSSYRNGNKLYFECGGYADDISKSRACPSTVGKTCARCGSLDIAYVFPTRSDLFCEKCRDHLNQPHIMGGTFVQFLKIEQYEEERSGQGKEQAEKGKEEAETEKRS